MATVSDTTAYNIIYYATRALATSYGSTCGEKGFTFYDKSTGTETIIINDEAWDTTALAWIPDYATNPPQATDVFSDAYGYYDKHFRLTYDGTTYKAYDSISMIDGSGHRVDVNGTFFRRWPPLKPPQEYRRSLRRLPRLLRTYYLSLTIAK